MSDDYWLWAGQVERSGFCVRPVRLRGTARAVDTGTGEVLGSFSTDGQPDGVLLKACGDRRAAVCPPCAARYRADTWHLIAAGLRGRGSAGDGPVSAAVATVPESVAAHPCVFVTLTAPGFGSVHTVRADGSCRPSGTRPRCVHGTARWCNTGHEAGSARLGEALCVECYDYVGQVLWQSAVPELWRRFTIGMGQSVSRLSADYAGAHLPVREVRRLLRVSFVKVAEWQRRGVVHLHAIVRLDGIDPDDRSRIVAPPSWVDGALLASSVRDAAARVRVALPCPDGRVRVAVWGGQLDVQPITDPARVAAYLAKYATKTASDVLAGLPVRRFGTGEIDRMRKRGVSWHLLMLAGTCLRLSEHPSCADLRLAVWVHTLGFPGHFASKSRRYSVTLSALRQVRRDWRASQHSDDIWKNDNTAVVGEWRLVGLGHPNAGDALAAEHLAHAEAVYREAVKHHDVTVLRHVDDRGEVGL